MHNDEAGRYAGPGVGLRRQRRYLTRRNASPRKRELRPGRRAVGYDSGASQRAPSGGTVMTAEAGLPCQGSGPASIAPMLPTPLPP